MLQTSDSRLQVIMVCSNKKAFMLIEVIMTIVITGFILIALFFVYDQTRSVSASIMGKIEERGYTADVLERISQDLNRLAGPGSDAIIEIQNTVASGFSSNDAKT